MKKVLILLPLLVLALALPGLADLSFCDKADIYTVIDDAWLGCNPDSVKWTHDNPYVGDYEDALDKGLIKGVTLTIVADDLDACDDVKIRFTDKDGGKHILGNLNTMTYTGPFLGPKDGPGSYNPGQISITTFILDPNWIDGVKVKAEVIAPCLSLGLVEIETSTLCVTAVPVPGAVLLGTLGLGLVGWIRRRFA